MSGDTNECVNGCSWMSWLVRWSCAFALGKLRPRDEEVIMKNRNYRLALKCIVLAIEVTRLANKLVALVSMAINYPLFPWQRSGLAVLS